MSLHRSWSRRGVRWTNWGGGFSFSFHYTSSLACFNFSSQNVSVQEETRRTENEDIHYGEIDFSKHRPGPSVQNSSQQQDLVYSQVKVRKAANSLTQTVEGPDCIYSQVQNKWVCWSVFGWMNVVAEKCSCVAHHREPLHRSSLLSIWTANGKIQRFWK